MKNKALILNLIEDKLTAEYLDADRKPLEKGAPANAAG